MATATYIPIATQTLGSAAASITFNSIPGTYTDLRLVLTCTTSATDVVTVQFNSDTAANYSVTSYWGNGTSANSSYSTSVTSAYVGFSASTSTTVPAMYLVDVFSYAGSTNKTALANAAADQNGSGAVSGVVALWRSTAAITSVKLLLVSGSNFNSGTIATLWGI